MSDTYIVLSAIGKDRVGIVDEISAELEQYRVNIEESRMAVLGGEFAIIMLISGNSDDLAVLKSKGEEIGNTVSLRVEIKYTEAPGETGKGRPYVIETFSLDAPGIVHAVSAVLHRFNINIEDLETDTSAAPWTGAAMFHMKAHIIIPQSVSISSLRDQLMSLEHERDLDINLKPVVAN